MTTQDILELAARVEAANDWPGAELQVAVAAVFGIEHRHYHRAGWKRIYDNGRPGSLIRPLTDLQDCRRMLENAGQLPEFINSNPRLACAAALKARAHTKGEE